MKNKAPNFMMMVLSAVLAAQLALPSFAAAGVVMKCRGVVMAADRCSMASAQKAGSSAMAGMPCCCGRHSSPASWPAVAAAHRIAMPDCQLIVRIVNNERPPVITSHRGWQLGAAASLAPPALQRPSAAAPCEVGSVVLASIVVRPQLLLTRSHGLRAPPLS